MRTLLQLALALTFTVGAGAQTCPTPYDGSPCILDYPTAPNIKTLRVGTLECTAWGHSPAASTIQIACCNTTCAGNYKGPLVYNAIFPVPGPFVSHDIRLDAKTHIRWSFQPGIGTLVMFWLGVEGSMSPLVAEEIGTF